MARWLHNLRLSFRVGGRLGLRQIQRSNIWITILIVAIMTITFLSNLVISGVLTGLVEGGNRANRDQYTGDVFLTPLAGESYITGTPTVAAALERIPQIEGFASRFTSGATIEANYRTRRDFNAEGNILAVTVAGIDPAKEDALTDLSDFIIEGDYLDASESGYILAGATWLEQYSTFGDLFEPLRDVEPGSRIRVSMSAPGSVINMDDPNNTSGITGQVTQEFIVKGIIDNKVGEVSGRFFITNQDFIRLTQRTNLYANEIAIDASEDVSDEALKEILVRNGIDRYAKIQTAGEAIPQFLKDIQTTFGTLGFLIGLIISGVGAITIFIVIYINALVRRKQIGILKGIGISRAAIEFSYITQALIYAFVGIGLALLITLAVIVPYVAQHPIDFPFSDGIVAVDAGLVLSRIIVVVIVSLLSGFLPAWLIVRRNTLDSILDR